MNNIIEHFKTIAAIPHCSREAERLFEFLKEFALRCGYEAEADEAKNLLIHKGNPKLCLQAHYDMVCMGKAPEIEIYEEDGWLMAKDSSLGADNGIGIAMMMELMEQGRELEFLLTSDEEIGLIGANALAFDLQSKMMLNLDSEDEAEVYIGCAGGADITAIKSFDTLADERPAYKISVSDLPGGHSGVDIDKDIPNAIKLLADYLGTISYSLVSIEGGERHNSIPANATAIIKSGIRPSATGLIQIEAIECNEAILRNGEEIVDLIRRFRHGVWATNEALQIPEQSINLAIISAKEGICRIDTSARAMSADGLAEVAETKVRFFQEFSFDTQAHNKYPSWKPQITDFTRLVEECIGEVFGTSKMMAIHAGLECGIIGEKYPSIKFASIGPTIRYPHSTREKVKIDSVDKTFELLENVIAKIADSSRIE